MSVAGLEARVTLHPFNLGRLCNHDDFNLALLAGELDEKGTVAMALSKLLGNQFDEIREKGLKIELGIPAGTFPGCTGKAQSCLPTYVR